MERLADSQTHRLLDCQTVRLLDSQTNKTKSSRLNAYAVTCGEYLSAGDCAFVWRSEIKNTGRGFLRVYSGKEGLEGFSQQGLQWGKVTQSVFRDPSALTLLALLLCYCGRKFIMQNNTNIKSAMVRANHLIINYPSIYFEIQRTQNVDFQY